jgi:2-C-methyl-D-erythritol 4-phosphate cytidylyltransferase
MRTVAVVLAGGSGLRLGGTVPKQLQLLAGQTLLEHSVSAFEQAPGIDQVVVVLPAEFVADGVKLLADRFGKLTDVIAGGTDRPGSTQRAIALLSGDGQAGPKRPDNDCNVLFHDAARPLVDQRIIADCVAALADCQALGVVVPTADTIVELVDGVMTSIPPRETLARCQTPQGFRLSVIRAAYELAAADLATTGFSATDDCGMVLRYRPDVKVRAVPGNERNLKVTYPADLRIAESLLAHRAQ